MSKNSNQSLSIIKFQYFILKIIILFLLMFIEVYSQEGLAAVPRVTDYFLINSGYNYKSGDELKFQSYNNIPELKFDDLNSKFFDFGFGLQQDINLRFLDNWFFLFHKFRTKMNYSKINYYIDKTIFVDGNDNINEVVSIPSKLSFNPEIHNLNIKIGLESMFIPIESIKRFKDIYIKLYLGASVAGYYFTNSQLTINQEHSNIDNYYLTDKKYTLMNNKKTIVINDFQNIFVLGYNYFIGFGFNFDFKNPLYRLAKLGSYQDENYLIISPQIYYINEIFNHHNDFFQNNSQISIKLELQLPINTDFDVRKYKEEGE